MAVEMQSSQSNPAGEVASAKRPKTGGRVKKPIEQLMAEARIRDELAGMKDDTTLPEELAAIYLCVSVAEMAEQRSTAKGKKAATGSKSDAGAKAPRIKMIKPIREGAAGQNQKVFYKLGHLRQYQESITVESSFDAAVKAGLYGFVSIHAPFFAQPEKRSDRGRTVVIGKAWDKLDPDWAKRFKDLLDGKLRAVWLTPAEAAASRWASLSAHKAFAKPWLAELKGERLAVKAAIEGTEFGEEITEIPIKK